MRKVTSNTEQLCLLLFGGNEQIFIPFISNVSAFFLVFSLRKIETLNSKS